MSLGLKTDRPLHKLITDKQNFQADMQTKCPKPNKEKKSTDPLHKITLKEISRVSIYTARPDDEY